jgi:hypothetical protein
MEKIIKYVKSFHGDIFGGYLRDRYANVRNSHDLDCRVDRELIKYLINVLSVDFNVMENLIGINYRKMDIISYTISQRNPSRGENPWSVKLDILCNSYTNWFSYPCDFDVNLLSENNDVLQVRPIISPAILHIPDRLNHIISRAISKRFALVTIPKNSFSDIIVLLIRSKSLIDRGWLMDDLYLGKNSWLFNKWKNIKSKPYDIRKRHTEKNIKSMIEQQDCCLCHETFKDDDIVFNSCCNHNFHWECYNTPTTPPSPSSSLELSGIYNWFNVKQSFLCPFCRQDTIHYSAIYLLQSIPLPPTPPTYPPPPPPPRPLNLNSNRIFGNSNNNNQNQNTQTNDIALENLSNILNQPYIPLLNM